MQRFKLTSKEVFDLPYEMRGTRYYYDDKLSGFGLRVGKKSKTYFAEGRVNGKSRRVKIGPATIFTTEQARKAAQTHLGNMIAGLDPNEIKAAAKAKSLVLSAAAERFFSTRKLKPKTEYDYKRKLATNFADWSNKPLKDISPQAMVRRFNDITANSGPAEANGSMRVFRSVWNFSRADNANSDGSYTLPDCPVNRISELRIWNEVERRETYISDDAMPHWYKAIEKLTSPNPVHAQDFRDYAELLLRTGLRRAEAGSMLWANVDMRAKTFTLKNTKNGKSPTFPMSTQIEAIFGRRQVMEEYPGSQYVFPSTGKYGWLNDPRKMLNSARRQSGIPFKLHDLRRSFTTIAERLDLGYFAVKRLLNHSEKADVTFGYVINDPERLRVPMQKISDEIDILISTIG